MRNVFDACIYITRASGRGLGYENREFFGPVKWHRADRRVGRIGYFFLFPHNAILKPTNFAGPVSCPAKFGSRYGTENTPLVNSGIEDGFIYSILVKNGTFHIPYTLYIQYRSIRIGQSHILYSDHQKISTFGDR